MELGLYSFADVAPDPRTGQVIGPRQRLQNLMEEIELADQVGLDVFGIGEHHRADFAVSAPAVVLAAAATRTKQIRLTSAVTVLSSDDPIRVFQQFSTLDLLSNGRAELMVGRGSFIESFPLFGYPLEQYDELFADKLEKLLKIRASGPGIYPRPERPLPIWIGVGGTPESAIRAGSLGLPMALAIIGGLPERFGPFVARYRSAGEAAGYDRAELPVSINSHGYIAETGEQARDECFPSYATVVEKIGRERGWPPMSRSSFDTQCSLRGALAVGSPRQVIDKILFQHELFGHQRFLLQMSLGPIAHAKVMKSIELFGTKVAPEVRKAVPANLAAEAALQI